MCECAVVEPVGSVIRRTADTGAFSSFASSASKTTGNFHSFPCASACADVAASHLFCAAHTICATPPPEDFTTLRWRRKNAAMQNKGRLTASECASVSQYHSITVSQYSLHPYFMRIQSQQHTAHTHTQTQQHA